MTEDRKALSQDKAAAGKPAATLEVRFRAAEVRRCVKGTHPAEFRAEAMYLIDASLFCAEAGSCAIAADRSDPMTGERELCVAVTSKDPEAAERIIRTTVKGTSYDHIAAIVRLREERAAA